MVVCFLTWPEAEFFFLSLSLKAPSNFGVSPINRLLFWVTSSCMVNTFIVYCRSLTSVNCYVRGELCICFCIGKSSIYCPQKPIHGMVLKKIHLSVPRAKCYVSLPYVQEGEYGRFRLSASTFCIWSHCLCVEVTVAHWQALERDVGCKSNFKYTYLFFTMFKFHTLKLSSLVERNPGQI